MLLNCDARIGLVMYEMVPHPHGLEDGIPQLCGVVGVKLVELTIERLLTC